MTGAEPLFPEIVTCYMKISKYRGPAPNCTSSIPTANCISVTSVVDSVLSIELIVEEMSIFLKTSMKLL